MKWTRTLQVAARSMACIAGIAFVVTPSNAQSFNIDIGATRSAPSASYGAASGQIGRWMNVPAGLPGIQFPLTELNGSASAVTASYTLGEPLSFDDPKTRGDDEELLDDGQRFSVPHVWKFLGLAPGIYDVFTYTWAPDRPLDYVTRTAVVGSADGSQEVGGRAWTGVFVQGAQYARHHVTVATGGELEIQLSLDARMLGTINGIQLRHEPLLSRMSSDIEALRGERDKAREALEELACCQSVSSRKRDS